MHYKEVAHLSSLSHKNRINISFKMINECQKKYVKYKKMCNENKCLTLYYNCLVEWRHDSYVVSGVSKGVTMRAIFSNPAG